MTPQPESTLSMYPPELMNLNDTASPSGSIPASQQSNIDVPKFSAADLKQLRKNIKRLQTMENQMKLKQTTHFDITQLFQLSKIRHK